ncbi:hypothetical protein ARALYDRAFT_338653 [Arabidopsis lyrata subsp. lyrata]|uniref:Uncharacterized protein n=1 Tax=Arabidopsis lyrata subsp. lyrata TaxID=81972 RepID=D7KQZ0_ARALL|nr:hypothetical protein ARALYDRAFT_338653 [Arabidopsis lyrata subsp. lyrata]
MLRFVVDPIFQSTEVDRGKKKLHESIEEDDDALAESDRPLKRLRRRGEGGSALTSPSLGSPTLEEPSTYDEENAPILLPYHPVPTKNDHDAGELIIPKVEPITNMPLSSIHPDSVERENSSVPMLEMEKTNGHVEEGAGETVSTADGTTNDVSPTTVGRFSEHKLAATIEEPSALELASSASGEVKINLSFAPATGGSNLYLPSMEELRRAMEEKCLRSYKILDPNFSVLGFMNDICSCYMDLATKGKDSANQLPKNLPFVTANIDALKKSAARMAFTSQGSNDHMRDVENGAVGDSMAVRAVEISRPGGRDGPHSSFVAEVKMLVVVLVLGFGDWCDILGLRWRGVKDGKLNCGAKQFAMAEISSSASSVCH